MNGVVFNEFLAVARDRFGLNDLAQLPSSFLHQAFGTYLFFRFSQQHEDFLAETEDALDCLPKLTEFVHELRENKLLNMESPEYQLSFSHETPLEITYQAQEGMEDFAKAILQGCLAYYEEEMEVIKKQQNRFILRPSMVQA